MAALRLWARVLLFLGTVSPLVVLQGLVAFTDSPRLGLAAAAAGAALLLVPLALFPLARRHIGPTPFTLEETKQATPDLGAFLLAYLLPLLALSLSERSDLVAFFLPLVLVGVVYTQGNLVHVQPIYWATSWRVH